MCPIRIEQVKDIMEQNLPDCWLPLEACLSAIGAAMLKDIDHCIGLILVGEPGGRKTTTIDLLGRADPIYLTDSFTPASFVSHDATKTPQQLEKIDLLPRIKHKILVVPELAPLFGQRYEDLIKDIATLTRVMDGQGYLSESGTHGRRGYEGDYRFNMIGATTPPQRRIWQAMGKLSSRWVFYRLERTADVFVDLDLTQDFPSKKKLCQAVVKEFLEGWWQGFGTQSWDRSKDSPDVLALLSWSASFMSKWRGLSEKQDLTGYNPPEIEAPYRLAESLYALARGHALLWGRRQVNTIEDGFFVTALNFTNMPEDRLRVFQAFPFSKTEEEWEAKQKAFEEGKPVKSGMKLGEVARIVGWSEDKVGRVLSELVELGALHKAKDELYYVRFM